MAFGYLLEAEYESGLVLTENESDHSPYDRGRNTFHAIVNGRSGDFGHGRMVRYSLIGVDGDDPQTYSYDWTAIPHAVPVYERSMRVEMYQDGRPPSDAICEAIRFGYRDGDAEEITEITWE